MVLYHLVRLLSSTTVWRTPWPSRRSSTCCSPRYHSLLPINSAESWVVTCSAFSQVMLNLPDEVTNLVSGKLALRSPSKHFVNNMGESKRFSFILLFSQTLWSRHGVDEGSCSRSQSSQPCRLPEGCQSLQGKIWTLTTHPPSLSVRKQKCLIL